MKRVLKWLVACAGTSLLAGSSVFVWHALAQQEQQAAVEEIGRDRIYCKPWQQGMMRIEGSPVDFGQYDDVLGPSNVFLVRGPKVYAAIADFIGVLASGKSADTLPLGVKAPEEDIVWLAAFLGISSSCQVASVEKRGKTLRLCYTEPQPQWSGDVLASVCFVRLGRLQPGEYVVELYSVDTQKITLSRRVVVEGK